MQLNFVPTQQGLCLLRKCTGAGNHSHPLKLFVPGNSRDLFQRVAVPGHWVRNGISLDVTVTLFE